MNQQSILSKSHVIDTSCFLRRLLGAAHGYDDELSAPELEAA